MGLQQFERKLERLVEGVFAKAFRSGLQPVELGRRLTREMDLRRTAGISGVIAPNRFVFGLAPADMERFGTFAEALTRELAEAARQHARDEGYTFVGPIDVELTQDGRVSAGTLDLDAHVVERTGGGAMATVVTPEGRRVEVGDDPIVIGRQADCDIELAHQYVSRRHAEVRRAGNGFVVVDLESANGTLVNGARVTERPLTDGDQIEIGTVILRFETS